MSVSPEQAAGGPGAALSSADLNAAQKTTLRRRALKVLLRLMILVFGAIVIFVLLLRWAEPMMLYPAPAIADWMYQPEQYGIEPEEHWITTSDGVRLHAWYVPPPTEGGPVALYSHGNGELVGSQGGRLEYFQDMGLGALAYDYRGYGKSDAVRIDERGATRDVTAAYDYLVGDLGVEPERVLAYGFSLGSAVTLALSEERPLKAIVLEAPFTDVPEVAGAVLRLGWLTPILRVSAANQYDNVRRASKLTVPLLVFHGRSDDVVPFYMGERVAESAPTDTTRFVPLVGVHNDGPYRDEDTYIPAMEAFLLKHYGVEPAAAMTLPHPAEPDTAESAASE